jgi:ankyrin repeat protein
LLQALAGDDVATLISAVPGRQNLDERLTNGESALFPAVLSGRIEFVEVMLAGGADPNLRATEPARDGLAPTPLDLAK